MCRIPLLDRLMSVPEAGIPAACADNFVAATLLLRSVEPGGVSGPESGDFLNCVRLYFVLAPLPAGGYGFG